ncbi:MAG: TIGR04255 family protein [Methylacidiphilales bacterium]|nr:TIGR04255 family protein [Candidatus Methylacidiphilales bacterium]
MVDYKKLTKCPLVSITIELRHDSNIQFGELYNVINTKLASRIKEKNTHGILTIPRDVRFNDTNLKYKPIQSFKIDNGCVWNFSEDGIFLQYSFDPIFKGEFYSGWENLNLSSEIKLVVDCLKALGVKSTTYLGYRVLNMFEGSKIFQHSNIDIKLNSKDLTAESENILISNEINKSSLKLKYIIAVNSKIIHPMKEFKGSYIDIDVSYNEFITTDTNDELVFKRVCQLHDEEKNCFFSILKESFVETLN